MTILKRNTVFLATPLLLLLSNCEKKTDYPQGGQSKHAIENMYAGDAKWWLANYQVDNIDSTNHYFPLGMLRYNANHWWKFLDKPKKQKEHYLVCGTASAGILFNNKSEFQVTDTHKGCKSMRDRGGLIHNIFVRNRNDLTHWRILKLTGSEIILECTYDHYYKIRLTKNESTS